MARPSSKGRQEPAPPSKARSKPSVTLVGRPKGKSKLDAASKESAGTSCQKDIQHANNVKYTLEVHGGNIRPDEKKIRKVETVLRKIFSATQLKSIGSEKISRAAVEILDALAEDAATNRTAAPRKAARPKGYKCYRGRKSKDGRPTDFYDKWWRDKDGNHTLYRAELKRLDPKLLQALENHVRENGLDRKKYMPPPLSKRAEDILNDHSAPESERFKAMQALATREQKLASYHRTKRNASQREPV
ncbi:MULTISPECIES: hypothetical protein [Alphaproteobacteria]|uniref:hypothetical protein n=1 Tax=Alphaproteobacteria TaxID=28211 RepID=UPI003298D7A6